MSIKRIKFFLGIFIPFLIFFLMSHNTFAASLQTSSFDLYYRVNNNSSYGWRNNITYGNNSPTIIDSGGGITRYQFNTPSVQAGGNYATIHFETNIVASAYVLIHNFNPWVNLPQQNILTCSASGIAVVSKNLSYATTYWTDQYNESNNTLTFYGDVVLSGFNPGSNYNLVCSIGSDSFSFINFNGGGVWFEQNPMSIVWSNDQSIALMNTQIEQQNTIINQNETIINNQNQNTQDIIRSNQNCQTSRNIFDGWTIGKKLSATNGSEIIEPNGAVSSSYLPVNSDTNYVFSGLPTGLYTFIAAYNSNLEFLGRTGASGGVPTKTFKTVPVSFSSGTPVGSGSISYVRITAYQSGNYNDNISVINSLQTQLETGITPTTYIPIGQEVCKNINEQYYDEQRQADQNISNQTASDIDGATNQQTTNLIGTISSFVSALSSINTNGSCQLTLPFPSLLGGNQVVNPCNGADKAPAIITAASSLLLITVFVPLAFILVKMIYNEIRSFTNG